MNNSEKFGKVLAAARELASKPVDEKSMASSLKDMGVMIYKPKPTEEAAAQVQKALSGVDVAGLTGLRSAYMLYGKCASFSELREIRTRVANTFMGALPSVQTVLATQVLMIWWWEAQSSVMAEEAEAEEEVVAETTE